MNTPTQRELVQHVGEGAQLATYSKDVRHEMCRSRHCAALVDVYIGSGKADVCFSCMRVWMRASQSSSKRVPFLCTSGDDCCIGAYELDQFQRHAVEMSMHTLARRAELGAWNYAWEHPLTEDDSIKGYSGTLNGRTAFAFVRADVWYLFGKRD